MAGNIDPGHLLNEALKLFAEARAALAGRLIESLDESNVDEGAEEAWNLEFVRRHQDVATGSVKAIPWAEARRRILMAADGSDTR